MPNRVLAVIVSYNPELESLAASITGLLAQCDVLVVDNASLNQDQVKQHCERLSVDEHSSSAKIYDLSYVGLPHNMGLGVAHNQGIAKAQTQGCDYVLLLDQDTQLTTNCLEILLSAHQRKTAAGNKISAVGASYAHGEQKESVYIRFGALKFSRHGAEEQDRDGCVATDFLISSGSLISTQALQQIGNMDEDLFIDHVDTEWFLRARAKGYQAYGVPGAKMRHSLGETSHVVSLNGRQRNVPQHKPFRYYYIFRNSILLYRRSYISALWKWNDIQRLFMIFAMFGILKAPRKKNLSMMFKGIWHGLAGKKGAQFKLDSAPFSSNK